MENLNYLVYFALIWLILFPGTDKLKKRVKALERQMKKKEKGKGKYMSKMLEELKGKECTFEMEEDDVTGVVLDVDDEWIKVEYEEKKEGKITEIIRIELIEKITLTEKCEE